jgi:hypothetical protein
LQQHALAWERLVTDEDIHIAAGAIMKQPSVLEWYRILRAHHLFTIFQAIRYALWLTR